MENDKDLPFLLKWKRNEINITEFNFAVIPLLITALQGSNIGLFVHSMYGKLIATEIESIRTALVECLAALRNEMWIIRRLLVRNRNQHRKALYYHKLQDLDRKWNNIEKLKIEGFLSYSSSNHALPLDALLYRIYGLSVFLQMSADAALKCGPSLLSIMGNGHWLGFTLCLVSLAGRFYVLLRTCCFQLDKLYTLLYLLRAQNRSKEDPNGDSKFLEQIKQYLGALPEPNIENIQNSSSAVIESKPAESKKRKIEENAPKLSSLQRPVNIQGAPSNKAATAQLFNKKKQKLGNQIESKNSNKS